MAILRRKPTGPPPVTADEVAVARRLLGTGNDVTPGGPVRCPDCAGWAMAERLDRETLRFDYRCPSCGEAWVLSGLALQAALREPAPADDTADEGAVVQITWGVPKPTGPASLAPRPAR